MVVPLAIGQFVALGLAEDAVEVGVEAVAVEVGLDVLFH